MGIFSSLRIEDFVQRADFWLELRGTKRRRRKELRRELRDNLRAAAQDVGVGAALANMGTPKQFAYEATAGEFETRPMWSRALMHAALAFGVVVFGIMYTAMTFAAGVEATGASGQTVSSFIFPWWGVEFMARIDESRGGQAFAIGATGVQWYIIGIPLLVFFLSARPWRLLTNRDAAQHRADELV